MRKILHRAKQINHNKCDEWYEGYYCELPCEDGSKVPSILFIAEESNVMIQMPVDPETLCDWSGQTDKNGKKIFERDIARYEDYIGVVRWNNDLAKFDFLYDGNIVTDFDSIFGYELEVIGNIHDNPELLEVRT